MIALVPAAPTSARLTRAEVGRVLGLGRRPIDRLVDGGWTSLSVGDVAALAARSAVVTDADLPVVRLGAPERDQDGRWIGIAPSFTDTSVEDAARMWWRVDPDRVLDAGVLIVTVGGFAVAVLGVDSLEDSDEYITEAGAHLTRYKFAAKLAARVDNLVQGTPRLVHDGRRTHALLPALGHRLPNPPGPPLVILPPNGQTGP